MSHIQINQQPTHCSHTSMNTTHPSMTNTLSFSSNPLPPVNQGNNFWFQNLQSNTQQQEWLPSNPFFVKFLTKQIRICQGCRSGYKRNEKGELLPPPDDLIVGHFECRTYNDQVTGIARLSRETCVHYHASPRCIYAKHPNFQPSKVCVPSEVMGRLHSIHKLFLNRISCWTIGLDCPWISCIDYIFDYPGVIII